MPSSNLRTGSFSWRITCRSLARSSSSRTAQCLSQASTRPCRSAAPWSTSQWSHSPIPAILALAPTKLSLLASSNKKSRRRVVGWASSASLQKTEMQTAMMMRGWSGVVPLTMEGMGAVVVITTSNPLKWLLINNCRLTHAHPTFLWMMRWDRRRSATKTSSRMSCPPRTSHATSQINSFNE